jgi:hypothetical protein
MGQKFTVAYYSTTMGVTQQKTGAPTIYHGKVFRIPKALFSEEGEVNFEKDIGELIQEIQEKGLEPVLHEATIERYETCDTESGDVWVMYRVPCNGESA